MKILAIDTATKTGSVAITSGDCILSERLLNVDTTHSENLLPAIAQMASETCLALKEIDLIAVTLGPGSFTGIRIGVGSVKGLALALDRPVAGVSTLEAMAANFPCSNRIIRPVMDARKSEVYTADFIWEKDGLERLSDDRALSPEKMLEGVREETIFVGDGLLKYGGLIKDTVGEMAFFADHFFSYIRASNVARLGQAVFEENGGLDLASFTPAYLRRSEAEVNREKGL